MKKEFCSTNGYIRYAGIHLVIEIWNAQFLSFISKVGKILKDSVSVCNATFLKINLRKFFPCGGISGITITPESQLSIHTWPEYKHAVLDIFVCREINPYKAIPSYLRRAIQ